MREQDINWITLPFNTSKTERVTNAIVFFSSLLFSYHWKYKSLVIVGVLPDKVDSPGSTHRHQRSFILEHLSVHTPSIGHQLGHTRIWTSHWAEGIKC